MTLEPQGQQQSAISTHIKRPITCCHFGYVF